MMVPAFLMKDQPRSHMERRTLPRVGMWYAIGYQCGFAYCIALMINQFGSVFVGKTNVIGLIFAVVILALMIYMLFRPYKEAETLSTKEATAAVK